MWSLLVGCAVSAYISWMREQRALERFAEQLGSAGERQLRRLRVQHPLWSHHRPVSCGLLGLWLVGDVLLRGCGLHWLLTFGGSLQALSSSHPCPAHLQPSGSSPPICEYRTVFSQPGSPCPCALLCCRPPCRPCSWQ